MQEVKQSHLSRNSRLAPSALIPIGKSVSFRSCLGFLRVIFCRGPGYGADSNARGEQCHSLLTQKGVSMWCVAVTVQ